ncbi:MAG: cation transporter [Planctomycetaceae bacterium]
MKSFVLTSVAFLASFSAFPLQAAEVTVKGVHLCCGACVDGVNEALTGIDGVSDVVCDRNTKVVAFKATDDDAAERGIEALSKGGFFGTAKHGKKDLPFPDAGAKKDATTATITFTGVHLCCGACVKDAHTAVKDVKGVSKVDVDREAGSVTLTGTDIVETEALAALNKGGFYGKVAE